MKKIISAIFAVLSFLAGVLVMFTRKSKAPYKTALTLEITPDQINSITEDGGAILFRDVNVKGSVAVQLKQYTPVS